MPLERRFLRAACLTLLLSLALAGQAAAQDNPAAGPEPGASPLELLQEHRAALGLTPGQLERLDRIRDRLATANDPLLERIMSLRSEFQAARRAARGGGEGDAARLQEIRSEAERTRGEIQRNNRTAMQAVNRMLTPAQRRELRAFVQERRRQNAGRRGGDANADGSR